MSLQTSLVRGYCVEQLFGWVNSHPEKHIKIPIDELLTYIRYDNWAEFESLKKERFHSLIAQPSCLERIQQVDLEHPVILSNDHRLIDGLIRLVKAIFEKQEFINIVFVSCKQVNQTMLSQLPSRPSHVNSLPFPDRYLSLPKSALPDDPLGRREVIEKYFPDFLPTVEANGEQYAVCLERPSSPYGCYLFDEGLREGLAWWKEGTRVRDIPAEYRLFKNGILALEEQWIPLSWSCTFKEIGFIPREMIILHLDDHQDMMAPRIGKRMDGVLIDYLSGEEVNFLNPDSVRSSIETGAIGKGSILTPLIWNTPKIHVRHLCFRAHPASSYHLERAAEADNILFTEPNRIALKFKEVAWDKLSQQSSYVVTPDVSFWMKDLPEDVPILLHFDLDYFNDRLDGDSNWESRSSGRCFDPDFSEQREQLNEIFRQIELAKIKTRILNVSVGISPGFYPAEFWKRMVEGLEHKISELGFDRSTKEYL